MVYEGDVCLSCPHTVGLQTCLYIVIDVQNVEACNVNIPSVCLGVIDVSCESTGPMLQ